MMFPTPVLKTFSPISGHYARSVASQALLGARAGKRVLVLLPGLRECVSVGQVVHAELHGKVPAPEAVIDRGYLDGAIQIHDGGSIRLVASSASLKELEYDLVVSTHGSLSPALREAVQHLTLDGSEA